MRRHGITIIGVGLALVGLVTGCSSDDSPESAAPTTSESSAVTAATTAASPMSGAAATDAAITLSAPANGATVGRSFVVRGSGVAFEGTLLWSLDGPGEPITGYASAGSTQKQPFQFTVEAREAGTYKLTVYRESAADGARTDVVEHTITVR
ncbi:Gmad2 immunoglobulin-like domain-containing protein [Cryptosporangium phraense]|nr:Gmad2 immunoglobulin-like domain-containing protein [Cryptosporangium phraense]